MIINATIVALLKHASIVLNGINDLYSSKRFDLNKEHVKDKIKELPV